MVFFVFPQLIQFLIAPLNVFFFTLPFKRNKKKVAGFYLEKNPENFV